MSAVRAAAIACVGALGAGAFGACGSEPAPIDATPYTVKLLDDARIGSDSTQPNFQRAAATLQPLGKTAAHAVLTVALTSTCYPFDKWATNPPPSGQNWPADCDAFDRNFEVLLGGPGDTRPRIELIRAITPFGGPLAVTADVTDPIWSTRSPKHARSRSTSRRGPMPRVRSAARRAVGTSARPSR